MTSSERLPPAKERFEMEQNRNNQHGEGASVPAIASRNATTGRGDRAPRASDVVETQNSQGGRGNLYQEVTARIIADLEAGRVPWVQPWNGASPGAPGMPTNAVTARRYSGINVIILWGAAIEHGYTCQRWLTFRQALALGGSVKRRERGTVVVYVDRFVPEDERRRAADAGDEARTVAFLKSFTVFNVDQCEGLPDTHRRPEATIEPEPIEPQLEALILAIRVDIRVGGTRACYNWHADRIDVPPRADQLVSHRPARAGPRQWVSRPLGA